MYYLEDEQITVEISESLYQFQDIELPVPLTSCNCGHRNCRGFYVKTHIGQNECLFSFRDKGLDLFLPSIEELRKAPFPRRIREV